MNRSSSILRFIAGFGLIFTMFASLAVTGSAQVIVNPDTFPDFFTADVNECYYAAVSNGEDFGLGASQTSITVQNLDDEAGVIYIFVGAGDGFDESEFAVLNPGASKTFTGADLGIAAGTVAPVVVAGYDFASSQAGDFTPADGIVIGCVAKQAVTGDNLPMTTAADTSVSGYNATSGREVGFFDELYLPIVQTNCGPGGCWNTIIRVANVGPFSNAAVTVRFFPAEDGSGSLQTGFQLQGLLSQGEVWSINLSEWVPEGWVGSAHILTDDNVVAIADRYKAGTDMWITNTAANAVAESDLQVPGGPANAPYLLYAPDIRLDYNGWNTGISVANTVPWDNNVSIQYFGNNGNAPQAQNQRLAAHGMDYFYNPSDPSEDECEQPADQVPTCDFVGAAIVLSEAPVAVAVDGVKYYGNDANVGQAFSYSATGNVFQFQAAPLVQKGNPADGMGATSGITFLNPNANSTFITVDWVNPSGFAASNFGDTIVWVPGFSTGFVYTMFEHNLPNGFQGSALVSSELPIAATTANVDYQVDGDGTAIWNLYNPCGLYRQLGDCVFVPAPEPLATKTFDIRPAGADALICVFDSVTGQDGKAIPPDTECVLESVFVKGGDGGGQDDVQTFVAVAGGVTITVDDNDNTITADVPAGSVAQLGVLTELDNAGNVVASGDNATCADIADPDLRLITIGGQISAEEFGLLSGNFENTILVVDGVCVDQLQEGTLRPETPEEAQERLGTVVPPFTTDAAGLASVDLVAGCYFFVVSAEGFETFISIEECLEPGETVNNIIDLVPIVVVPPPPPTFGMLTKALDLGAELSAGVLAGDYSLNSVVYFCEGVITNTADCDALTDPAVVAHGGFDDFGGGFTFEMSAIVETGQYTICSAASVTGDFDLDGDLDTVGYPFTCESEADISVGAIGHAPTFDGVIEPIIVQEDLETYVLNDFAALITGVLDVFVRDELTDLPLAGAEVCLYDADNVQVACAITGADGIASFADVVAGTYTTNASAVAYEDEASTFVYDVLADAFNGGLNDTTEATADVVHALDPAGAIAGVLVTLDGAAVGAGVAVTLYDEFCTVVLAVGVTDATGLAEFGVAPGTYCAGSDPGGNTVETLSGPFAVGPADPAGDVDATINELTAALGVSVDDQVVNGRNQVSVFLADAGDTLGIGGNCTGAFVTSGMTNLVGGSDAAFTDIDYIDFVVEGNTTYCVEALPGDFFGPGVDVDQVFIFAGDPAGDVDLFTTPQ